MDVFRPDFMAFNHRGYALPLAVDSISGGGRSVYFAGDTMLIPELLTLPDRFGRFDVALLPVNGLQIRPLVKA